MHIWLVWHWKHDKKYSPSQESREIATTGWFNTVITTRCGGTIFLFHTGIVQTCGMVLETSLPLISVYITIFWLVAITSGLFYTIVTDTKSTRQPDTRTGSDVSLWLCCEDVPAMVCFIQAVAHVCHHTADMGAMVLALRAQPWPPWETYHGWPHLVVARHTSGWWSLLPGFNSSRL
jgi:hypothetical protein